MPIYKTDIKKDGLQQYRVRINYTGRDGKAKQLTRIAYGAAEAKQLEAELMKQHAAGEIISADNKITVNKLFEEYIKSKSSEVRKSSLNKTEAVFKNGILPYMKDVRIDKLNSKLLQEWKNKISEKNLSITTRNNYYGEFRAMLNYAVKMEYLQKNPLLLVGNFRDAYFERSPEKLRYYTSEQFKLYIAEAKKKAEQSGTISEWGYYVFFCIAFYTGARKGEINALKWTDIDGDIMHIRRSITQKLKGGDVETPPKNKSSYRDLQMPKPLIDILVEHKNRQMSDKNFTNDYRICGGIACLRDSSICNRNNIYAKSANLPHIRIHDFRHSHATLLANEGINIQEIARRLGHSDIQQTWQTYSHLYPREEERAVKILDKIV